LLIELKIVREIFDLERAGRQPVTALSTFGRTAKANSVFAKAKGFGGIRADSIPHEYV